MVNIQLLCVGKLKEKHFAAACAEYVNLDFLYFCFLALYLSSTPPIALREHYRRMLGIAPLTDFLKVLLITTQSPSSAHWQFLCIIIPS